ncbi:hypothetical protein NAG74_23640 [Sinorhizobium meliloti]|nr:hypothetical protein [Sinorhizobium meliloti]MCO5964802.1 hypothetical protein [Sinorhizobium meliloti]
MNVANLIAEQNLSIETEGGLGHPYSPQMLGAVRDLALFNLAIDSKLRACDLVAISVGDVSISGRVRDRAIIVQKKTGRPVQSN